MIVGGSGTLFGPVLGAAFLTVIREELSIYWEHYLLVVGVIVILCVSYAPKGIMGLLKSWLGPNLENSRTATPAVNGAAADQKGDP